MTVSISSVSIETVMEYISLFPGSAQPLIIEHPADLNTLTSTPADDLELRQVLCSYIEKGIESIWLRPTSTPFSSFTRRQVIRIIREIVEWKPSAKAAIEVPDELAVFITLEKGPKRPQKEIEVRGLVSILITDVLGYFPGLVLDPETWVCGFQSHGKIDFTIKKKGSEVILGAIEVKSLAELEQGIAQNAMQMEAVLTDRERDIDGRDTIYGIVTTFSSWCFLKCKVTRGDRGHPLTKVELFRFNGTITLDRNGWETEVHEVYKAVVWMIELMKSA